MGTIINAIQRCKNIPECTTVEELQMDIIDNEKVGILSNYILQDWPATKAKVQKEVQQYSSFRDEIAVIDGIAMKGTSIMIPTLLQKKVFDKLYINHIAIEKMKLLVCDKHKC